MLNSFIVVSGYLERSCSSTPNVCKPNVLPSLQISGETNWKSPNDDEPDNLKKHNTVELDSL